VERDDFSDTTDATLRTVVLEQIAEAIIITDATGRITFVNEAAKRLHGVAELGVALEGWSKTYHLLTMEGEPYPPAELPLARALLQRETVYDALWRIQRPDGTVVIAEGTALPLSLQGGEPLGAVLVARDVTELHEGAAALKKSLSALHASEDHYRHAMELNPQVPWTADPEGAILDFSQRWLDLTGMTREHALGGGWAQVPHPDDLSAMGAAWTHSVRTGDPYDIEHRIRLADSTYRWMRSRAFPRRDGDGNIVVWYGTTEDIEERKRAELDREAMVMNQRRFLREMLRGFTEGKLRLCDSPCGPARRTAARVGGDRAFDCDAAGHPELGEDRHPWPPLPPGALPGSRDRRW
jgi:PAS domain S-box-containing protein